MQLVMVRQEMFDALGDARLGPSRPRLSPAAAAAQATAAAGSGSGSLRALTFTAQQAQQAAAAAVLAAQVAQPRQASYIRYVLGALARVVAQALAEHCMQQVKACSGAGGGAPGKGSCKRGGKADAAAGGPAAMPKALYAQLSAEVAFLSEALRGWFHSVDAALVRTLEPDLLRAMQPPKPAADAAEAVEAAAAAAAAPVAAQAEAAARAEQMAAVQAAKEAVLAGARRRTRLCQAALAPCP